MRTITLIIIHCSATSEGRSLSTEACRQDYVLHRRSRDIDYHFYITRGGETYQGRPLEEIETHCRDHNTHSIGICYEGGLDMAGCPKDTRALAQRASLLGLLRELRKIFPKTLIIGHHDLNLIKECPRFNCTEEYRELDGII